MPAVSERQRRAMFAAAKGKSKVGIPQATAQRFVKHTKAADAAARRKASKHAAS